MNDYELGLTDEVFEKQKNPCLPGFEGEAAEDAEAEPSAEETPAKPDRDPAGKAPIALNRAIAYTGIAAVTAIVLVSAYKLIVPRTVIKEIVKEVEVEPDGVPLEILPDTADPALWDIVANMSGTIEGIDLEFRRGRARAKGIDFKVCLDFCQGKDYVYARLAAGATNWVVAVDADRKIVKVYRIPRKNRKPLRDILAR